MSDTPRTDAVWEKFRTGDLKDLDPDVEFSELARQLERELNAAKERIKRLEKAGDGMMQKILASGFYGVITQDEVGAITADWRKAKEEKP